MTRETGELQAWAEFKQVVAACTPAQLPTLFYGTVSERDNLMDDIGLCRESWWLVDVLIMDNANIGPPVQRQTI